MLSTMVRDFALLSAHKVAGHEKVRRNGYDDVPWVDLVDQPVAGPGSHAGDTDRRDHQDVALTAWEPVPRRG